MHADANGGEEEATHELRTDRRQRAASASKLATHGERVDHARDGEEEAAHVLKVKERRRPVALVSACVADLEDMQRDDDRH